MLCWGRWMGRSLKFEMRIYKIYLLLVVILMLSSCKHRIIAIYNGCVSDSEGQKLNRVEVIALGNGKAKEIGELHYPRIFSDTNGQFNELVVAQYYFDKPEIKILFKKEGYKVDTLTITNGIHENVKITLDRL